MRALGAVLGSLADLGFDARWCVLRASDVGAPHRRERIFLAAWPSWRTAAAENADEQPGDERRQSASGEAEGGRPRPEPGGRGGVAAADAEGVRRGQGVAEPASRQRGPDLALGGSPLSACSKHGIRAHGRAAHGHPLRDAYDAGAGSVRGGGRPQTWGPYAAAIARWEGVTRPAPRPTDEAGRLSPLFVEWMQGLAPGWVTATPGLGRPAQLSALGNGVVPQQAARALEILAPPLPVCGRHGSR